MSQAITFETHPAVQHERLQPLTRFDCKRRRSLEAAAHLRRIDAEQTHATDARDPDCIAVEYVGYERDQIAVTPGTTLFIHGYDARQRHKDDTE